MTHAHVPPLSATADTLDQPFVMDEDAFRVLYDRTSRSVWVYLWRMTRDQQAADDLLQDTYYRFLRAPGVYESDAHQRNTLFRIATNLVRDSRRRVQPWVPMTAGTEAQAEARPDAVHRSAERTDVQRALARLRPRDRDLLWLAYAEGSSHQEIARSLGLRTSSIRLLLFRARRRMADLLRGPATRRGETLR